MKWRPIKTAPRDKLILLAQPPYNPHEHEWLVMQGRWIEVPHTNEIMANLAANKAVSFLRPIKRWFGCYPGIMLHSYSAAHGQWFSYEERPITIYPSHWMPLPEPPKGKYKQPR